MQCGQEFSFSDLKCKLVINVLDGKILGNIIDVIFFPQTGKILGFVVPGEKKGWFKQAENIFIPYSCVCKVGVDVILVELFIDSCPPGKGNNKLNNLIGILDENGKPITQNTMQSGKEKAQNKIIYDRNNAQNDYNLSQMELEKQYQTFNNENFEN